MKYMVVGAGGTGGCIAGFMAKAGKDVVLLSRGETAEVIRERGLTLRSGNLGDITVPVIVRTEADYPEVPDERPDVVFVCVKAYSLREIAGLLQRVCRRDTAVIPILNGIGMGDRLAALVPEARVLDGCIYIFADRTAPGEFAQRGKVFRIVFGPRNPAEDFGPLLEDIKKDLEDAGIKGEVSGNIQKDTLLKLSYVSAHAAVGSLYGANVREILEDPEKFRLFLALTEEIQAAAEALGIIAGLDLVERNAEILRKGVPDGTTSLQRDLAAGGRTEMDSLVFDLVRLGKKAGVPMPNYERVARHFGYSE